MKWVRRLSLRNRLLVSFLLVAMVPLLTFQTVFFRFLQNRTLSQEMELAGNEAAQLAEDYRSLFDRVTVSADNLAKFRLLETYLDSSYESVYDAYEYYIDNIHPMLEIGGSIQQGASICVHHGRTGIPVVSSELHPDLGEFLSKYPDPAPDGSWHIGTRWSYERTSVALRYLLPVFAPDPERYPETEWVIECKLTEAALAAPLRKERSGEAFLTTADGSVLAAGNRRYRDDSLTESLKDVIPRLKEAQPPEIELDGVKYLVFSQQVKDYLVLYLFSADSIRGQYVRTLGVYLAICVLVLCLMTLAIHWTADSLTAGIRRLSEKMQTFDRTQIKKLASEPTDRSSKNEADQLDAVFTDMMASIDQLVMTVDQQKIALQDEIIARQEVEISRIDAESRALQHQINPHYLFNTLEAIRMKLILKEDRETAEIIRLFAESFRRYMEDHETFVPLREELAFVEKYIRIQNYRFEDKIRYSCMADPELLDCRVLKLVIQPLVENAILHGLAQRDHQGSVRLSIGKEREMIRIRVEDDGVGMTAEELAELRTRIALNKEQPSSVGLPNIARRIHLVYGETASCAIDSMPGQGTVVSLLIPRKE